MSAYERLGASAPWPSRMRSTPAQTAPWSEAKLRALRMERATVTVLAARTLGARLTAALPVAASDTECPRGQDRDRRDRKSTRLNSSHVEISYAVFCLKKKKNKEL